MKITKFETAHFPLRYMLTHVVQQHRFSCVITDMNGTVS